MSLTTVSPTPSKVCRGRQLQIWGQSSQQKAGLPAGRPYTHAYFPCLRYRGTHLSLRARPPPWLSSLSAPLQPHPSAGCAGSSKVRSSQSRAYICNSVSLIVTVRRRNTNDGMNPGLYVPKSRSVRLCQPLSHTISWRANLTFPV